MSGLVAFVIGMMKELVGTFAGAGEASVSEATGDMAHGGSPETTPVQTHAAAEVAGEQSGAPSGWAAAANDNLSALYAGVASHESLPLTQSGDAQSGDAAGSVIQSWIEAGVIALGDLPDAALFQSNAGDADDIDHSIAKAFDALQRANALFDGGTHDVVIIDTAYAGDWHGYSDLPFA